MKMEKEFWEQRFNKEILCDCDGGDTNGDHEEDSHTISNPKDIKDFISKERKLLIQKIWSEAKQYKAMPKNFINFLEQLK